MLTDRLRDPALPLESKAELAFLVLEIEDHPSLATERAAEAVVRTFEGPVSGQLLRSGLVKRLAEVANRIEPNAAARILLAGLEHATDAGTRGAIGLWRYRQPSLAAGASGGSAGVQPGG